jgi:hypothetical protein
MRIGPALLISASKIASRTAINLQQFSSLDTIVSSQLAEDFGLYICRNTIYSDGDESYIINLGFDTWTYILSADSKVAQHEAPASALSTW